MEKVEVTYNDLPKKIKQLRKKKSITQKELAEKVKVTQQTISAIESGKLEPSLKLLFLIAGILGVAFILVTLMNGGEK
jgi:putative transcriptional regulator